MSDRQVAARARHHAYALDPVSFVRRNAKAVGDRTIWLRPAPETMTLLTALLPVTQGVACLAALRQAAASARSAGDPRSAGNTMADTLVERVTGQAKAAETPVEVQLVMTDRTLLAGDDEPARVAGAGPLPAPVARQLLRDLPDSAATFIRRLFAEPGTGRLVVMESGRRSFEGNLRRMVIARDESCRMPYCDGAIKHLDHVVAKVDGGATSEFDGQGLCERCNYTKANPGWRSSPDPVGGAGTGVTIQTPTGHTYHSIPPPLPGSPPIPTEEPLLPPMKRLHLPALEIYYPPSRHALRDQPDVRQTPSRQLRDLDHSPSP